MLPERTLILLSVLCAGSSVVAQAPLDRQFERVFFARRELWIDRLVERAEPEVRKRALPALRTAVQHRGWADSLAGERCRRLARAAAALTGRDPKTVLSRFNWFLLGLPEVVDPNKLERDRVKLGEITRSLYPMLKPVVVDDPEKPVANADKVFLTARGVFGFDKPKGLRLRFRVADDAGATIGMVERGDSKKDAAGWLMFDLFAGIPVAGKKAGVLTAQAEIGIDGEWPAADAPPLHVRAHMAPDYFSRTWKLLDLRAELAKREVVDAMAMRRLEVLSAEVMRPLLGREYTLRSWPTRALEEALDLARRLRANEDVPPLAERGDEVHGVAVKDATGERVVPLRLVWGSREPKRAYLVMPPSGFDENYAIEGLGIASDELQKLDAVFAFATFPTGRGYLESVQAILAKRFAIEPSRTTLVGVLDGATRSRYALGLLKGPLAEIALIGRGTPDVQLLGSDLVRRVRVIPAWGSPDEGELARARKLVDAQPGDSRHVAIHPVGPRSFRAAFRMLLGR